MNSKDSNRLLVCGIDPGRLGSFFAVDEVGRPDFKITMPLMGNKIDPYGIWRLLK
ncbi:unnamed protein product, partial [marine sediment metagenome]